MAKHHDLELRIVEVKGSLPVGHMPKPGPAMPQALRAPSRAEALEALKSMKGAASAIERIPMLGNTTSWTEAAFWSPVQARVATRPSGNYPWLWHCDFTPSFDLVSAYSNPPGEGMVYFGGPQPLVGPLIGPAEPFSGQVWCYLDVPVSNFYLFVAQVITDSESATIEWGIDTSVLGTVTLAPGGPYNHTFLVQLSAGDHRFVINQVTGSMYFVSVTAWQIPYPIPQPVTYDESELRIVEVKGSLPIRHVPRPGPAMPQPLRAPSRAEALEALKSIKGTASAIERIPILGDTTYWTDAAFWSPLKSTGSTLATNGGIFIWRCDFTQWTPLGAAYSEPTLQGVYFAGTDPVGSVEPPPGPPSGQVSCYLDVQDPGVYLFVPQVVTNGWDPDYTATFECWADTSSLGTVAVQGGGLPPNWPAFLVALDSGLHRFLIQQVTGEIYFFSLTAWAFPTLRLG
jgi:hypothetical protein